MRGKNPLDDVTDLNSVTSVLSLNRSILKSPMISTSLEGAPWRTRESMLAIKLLAEEFGGLYVTPSNFEMLFISMDTNRVSNSSLEWHNLSTFI